MEDDEKDDKDSAIDRKSGLDLNADIVNPGEVDNSVGDATSALSGAIGKGIGNANKITWEVEKRVSDKITYFLGRNVQSNKVFGSYSPNIFSLYFITNFLFPPIR